MATAISFGGIAPLADGAWENTVTGCRSRRISTSRRVLPVSRGQGSRTSKAPGGPLAGKKPGSAATVGSLKKSPGRRQTAGLGPRSWGPRSTGGVAGPMSPTMARSSLRVPEGWLRPHRRLSPFRCRWHDRNIDENDQQGAVTPPASAYSLPSLRHARRRCTSMCIHSYDEVREAVSDRAAFTTRAGVATTPGAIRLRLERCAMAGAAPR